MPTESPRYRDPQLPVETRVDDLLARMTLAEKVDQLHQCGLGDVNPNNLAARFDEFRPTYGSFIQNGLYPDLALRNALQRRCVEESRLGIPAIFGCDVIHGYRAIWPIPLAQACTWDPALIEWSCDLLGGGDGAGAGRRLDLRPDGRSLRRPALGPDRGNLWRVAPRLRGLCGGFRARLPG